MSEEKEIDWKGAPPPPDGRRGKFSPYLFRDWKVGDTEAFPVDEHKQIRSAIGNLNRDKKWRFRYAKVEERGRHRVRVWRVK